MAAKACNKPKGLPKPFQSGAHQASQPRTPTQGDSDGKGQRSLIRLGGWTCAASRVLKPAFAVLKKGGNGRLAAMIDLALDATRCLFAVVVQRDDSRPRLIGLPASLHEQPKPTQNWSNVCGPTPPAYPYIQTDRMMVPLECPGEIFSPHLYLYWTQSIPVYTVSCNILHSNSHET